MAVSLSITTWVAHNSYTKPNIIQKIQERQKKKGETKRLDRNQSPWMQHLINMFWECAIV